MKMPTKKQVLKASEKCSDAKEILKDLFPDAFNEEDGWEEIPADELTYKSQCNTGGSYLTIWYDNEEIACMDYYAKTVQDKEGRSVEVRLNIDYSEHFKIEPDDPKDSYGNFRIYKKV